ncbi:retron Ec78 anti-phage system effector HNH endonuclease PtuB [Shewanella acanthi]|uniref:retron Ec78 anti-phage system effector HNH endonuclease PtuB n=1 Tax=Shewanella acanthi TaxID=2864212 RepID=UPI001C65FDDC|nr:retron Ec78 anti-phage system effector HNH endonuclease PtuB [Shewanella acanthi]QYJ79856.1 TIGR02646 family protein [Shewanella acanthi]
MKKLVRTQLKFLDDFSLANSDWMSVPKEEIWEALDKMQGGFCVYCECKLVRKHIEHFKTRDEFPQDTFKWDNLFGSCGDSTKPGGWNRCGIYKDSRAGNYNINEIIKPDVDDPNEYFLFLTSGKIEPKNEISEINLKKAQETIRVLNLNDDTTLFNRRKNAILAIQDEIEELYELQDELADDFNTFLNDNINETIGKEFKTALEHAWIFNKKY